VAASTKRTRIKWLDTPLKRDYPAAQSYLELVLRPKDAKRLVQKIKRAAISEFAAKDIFRASQLPMLSITDSHVEKYRSLIILKQPVSPLLLCRDPARGKLVIADGYHRLCAVYSFDEEAMIPCQIA
jgi:disulfide oxidoreductase YuzD